MRTASFALVMLFAPALRASDYGAIVRPSEISINESPATLRLRGGFIIGNEITPDGTTELACPAGDAADCLAQWRRMKTAHCYAIGWDFAPPVVKSGAAPVPWATARGVREIAQTDASCAAVPGDVPVGAPPIANVVPAEAGTLPPPGFHAEDRLHHGALFTGLGLMVGGASLALASWYAFDRGGVMVLGSLVAICGAGLFAYGLTTHRVFVRDRVSIAPVLLPRTTGAMISIVF